MTTPTQPLRGEAHDEMPDDRWMRQAKAAQADRQPTLAQQVADLERKWEETRTANMRISTELVVAKGERDRQHELVLERDAEIKREAELRCQFESEASELRADLRELRDKNDRLVNEHTYCPKPGEKLEEVDMTDGEPVTVDQLHDGDRVRVVIEGVHRADRVTQFVANEEGQPLVTFLGLQQAASITRLPQPEPEYGEPNWQPYDLATDEPGGDPRWIYMPGGGASVWLGVHTRNWYCRDDADLPARLYRVERPARQEPSRG